MPNGIVKFRTEPKSLNRTKSPVVGRSELSVGVLAVGSFTLMPTGESAGALIRGRS